MSDDAASQPEQDPAPEADPSLRPEDDELRTLAISILQLIRTHAPGLRMQRVHLWCDSSNIGEWTQLLRRVRATDDLGPFAAAVDVLTECFKEESRFRDLMRLLEEQLPWLWMLAGENIRMTRRSRHGVMWVVDDPNDEPELDWNDPISPSLGDNESLRNEVNAVVSETLASIKDRVYELAEDLDGWVPRSGNMRGRAVCEAVASGTLRAIPSDDLLRGLAKLASIGVDVPSLGRENDAHSQRPVGHSPPPSEPPDEYPTPPSDVDLDRWLHSLPRNQQDRVGWRVEREHRKRLETRSQSEDAGLQPTPPVDRPARDRLALRAGAGPKGDLAILDGEEYALAGTKSLAFLRMLQNAGGQPVSAKAIELETGERPSRTLERLQGPLVAIVERPARRGSGYRMR